MKKFKNQKLKWKMTNQKLKKGNSHGLTLMNTDKKKLKNIFLFLQKYNVGGKLGNLCVSVQICG
jgi:hypothetical protein